MYQQRSPEHTLHRSTSLSHPNVVHTFKVCSLAWDHSKQDHGTSDTSSGKPAASRNASQKAMLHDVEAANVPSGQGSFGEAASPYPQGSYVEVDELDEAAKQGLESETWLVLEVHLVCMRMMHVFGMWSLLWYSHVNTGHASGPCHWLVCAGPCASILMLKRACAGAVL